MLEFNFASYLTFKWSRFTAAFTNLQVYDMVLLPFANDEEVPLRRISSIAPRTLHSAFFLSFTGLLQVPCLLDMRGR